MKVLTLDSERFGLECDRLQREVAQSYAPDLVVSIATGGTYVGERIFPGVAHAEVTCRRPSSGGKDSSRALFAIIKRMPLWLRDALRKAEARLLSRRGERLRTVEADDAARAAIKAARRILIVDDAVDSGYSLAAVIAEIGALAPEAEVRSAAITVTTPSPAMCPDYSLYSQILIRFPWSKDFR